MKLDPNNNNSDKSTKNTKNEDSTIDLSKESLTNIVESDITVKEQIHNWPQVKRILLQCLDFDVNTQFGCIQIFDQEDGRVQIGVHAEGPTKSIDGISYNQERTIFYNFDFQGVVTSSYSDLKPYQWDDAFGPIYHSCGVEETVPYSATEIVSSIVDRVNLA